MKTYTYTYKDEKGKEFIECVRAINEPDALIKAKSIRPDAVIYGQLVTKIEEDGTKTRYDLEELN